MRIVYMGNNYVGWEVLNWLKERKEDIVGLVVHPKKEATQYARDSYIDAIKAVSGLDKKYIFDGSKINKPATIKKIRELEPDIGLSIFFAYIFKSPIIKVFPKGIINLHRSYLPYNKGMHTNVWGIIDGTPTGATLHYVDEGVDTGKIIIQEELLDEPWDTGKTLYHKQEKLCIDIVKKNWLKIKHGAFLAAPQPPDEGTHHMGKDLQTLDEIDLNQTYKAKELINILRARTFPPYKGAYFMHNGEKVYININFERENG